MDAETRWQEKGQMQQLRGQRADQAGRQEGEMSSLWWNRIQVLTLK
jgi:hypothetical protein